MAHYICKHCKTKFSDEIDELSKILGVYNPAILCNKCGNFICNGQCRSREAYCARCGEKVPVVYACPECWSTDIEFIGDDYEPDDFSCEDDSECCYDEEDEDCIDSEKESTEE